MLDGITMQGERVVEMFTKCASAPDDAELAKAADEALEYLDALLAGEEAIRPLNGFGSA